MDISSYLHALNLCLKEKSCDSQIECTMRKFVMWERRVVQNNKSFDNLCEHLNKVARQILTCVASAIREHLQALRKHLLEYIPLLNVQHCRIQNTFAPHKEDVSVPESSSAFG